MHKKRFKSTSEYNLSRLFGFRSACYIFTALALTQTSEIQGAQGSQIRIPKMASSGIDQNDFDQPPYPDYPKASMSTPNEGTEKISRVKLHMKGRKTTSKDHQAKNQELTVTIDNLHFSGLTVYSQEEIHALFQPVLGKPTSIKDFVKISELLIHKYWDDGYVLAEAEIKFDEFDPESREATIHIYEGQVKRTSVRGGDEGIRALILNYVSLVEDTRPFRTEAFEHYDSLTNYIPGLTIWGKTRPIENDPGSGTLEVTANQKRFLPYYSIDNRGSKFVGPYRGIAGAYAMSILKKGDVVNMTLIGTPSKELAYGRMSYVFPLNYHGDSVYVRADYGKVQPGYTVKQDNIVEHDFTFELLYQHLTFAVPGHQITFKVGMDAFATDAITPTSRIYADQIREIIVGIGDSFIDPSGGKNLGELRLYQGFSELGGKNRLPMYRSAVDGEATATRLLGELTHSHPLPNRFSLVLSGRGQFAFQPVLAATAFYFGSYPFGSAYDPGELSGDNGLAGRLEGRYNFEPEGDFFNRAHTYLFYDGGKVWNRNISSGYLGKSGTSAGGGLRLMICRNYETDFELAKPLTLKLRQMLADGTTRPWRFFFRVTGRF